MWSLVCRDIGIKWCLQSQCTNTSITPWDNGVNVYQRAVFTDYRIRDLIQADDCGMKGTQKCMDSIAEVEYLEFRSTTNVFFVLFHQVVPALLGLKWQVLLILEKKFSCWGDSKVLEFSKYVSIYICIYIYILLLVILLCFGNMGRMDADLCFVCQQRRYKVICVIMFICLFSEAVISLL